MNISSSLLLFFFFNDTATTEIYTLSLHDALPICAEPPARRQRIGRRLYAEDVARAADRMKEPGLATGFQLPPQIRHEHLDGVRDGERVVAPHLVQQLLARDHEALVAHEVLEQLELALGELDLPVPAADLVGVGVEGQVAHAQRR